MSDNCTLVVILRSLVPTDNLLHSAVEQVIVLGEGCPRKTGVGEAGIVDVVVVVVSCVGHVHDADRRRMLGRQMLFAALLLERLQFAGAAQRRAQKLLLARNSFLLFAPLPLVLLRQEVTSLIHFLSQVNIDCFVNPKARARLLFFSPVRVAFGYF